MWNFILSILLLYKVICDRKENKITNNKAELFPLKLILSLVVEKRVENIQVMGDSMLITNWINVVIQV